LPRTKTTCLSILPVAPLRVIKVSPFSFPFLSLSLSLSFSLSACLPPSSFPRSPMPLSPSIWRSFLFLLWRLSPLSPAVFLLNDRPFTAVSDGVAGARRFPQESRVSPIPSGSPFLCLIPPCLPASLPAVSSSLCYWLSPFIVIDFANVSPLWVESRVSPYKRRFAASGISPPHFVSIKRHSLRVINVRIITMGNNESTLDVEHSP